MSIHRDIATLLDRPLGRGLLAATASWTARRISRADVQVLYRDGVWMHRAGPNLFPDGARFRYCRDEFRRWPREAERDVATARSHWFHVGEPHAGETIIDVGAGRGEDLLAFLAAVGPRGRVVAIEAHPVTYGLLTRFCRLNGLNRVRTVHAATLDRAGVARIQDQADWRDNAVDDGGPVVVPARTLDDIGDECAAEPVALLKLNIEGSELGALRGAARVLARTRLVAVACHDFRADRGEGERFRTRAGVRRLLEAAGFAVSSRRDDPRPGIRDHLFGVRCPS